MSDNTEDLREFTELNVAETEEGTFDPFTEISPTDLEPMAVESSEPVAEAEPVELDSVDAAIQVYDDTAFQTQSTRRQILNSLTPSINSFSIGPADDADMINCKLRLLDQTRQILNDMDASARNSANIRFKKAALAEQHQANINVVEILSKINLTQANQAAWAVDDVNHPVYDNEAELAAQLDRITKHEVITPGELEISPGKLPRPEAKDENDPFAE